MKIVSINSAPTARNEDGARGRYNRHRHDH
jgi:hypothetical protein